MTQLLTNIVPTLLKNNNGEINNIHNIDKSKTSNIKNHRFLTEHYYNKKQNVNNSIIENTTKNITNNAGNVLNVKKIIRIKPM